MKRSELIAIEDNNKFIGLLSKAKMSHADKAVLVRQRWDYLYNKYRPDPAHVEARKDYGKRGGAA